MNDPILINAPTQSNCLGLFVLRITASALLLQPRENVCLVKKKRRNKLRQPASDVNDLIARHEWIRSIPREVSIENFFLCLKKRISNPHKLMRFNCNDYVCSSRVAMQLIQTQKISKLLKLNNWLKMHGETPSWIYNRYIKSGK